jgi:hypothetical protein
MFGPGIAQYLNKNVKAFIKLYLLRLSSEKKLPVPVRKNNIITDTERI